jgi:hypothetical protein
LGISAERNRALGQRSSAGAEVLSEVRVQEDKFARLANAIPVDKYTWRMQPSEYVLQILLGAAVGWSGPHLTQHV